jgi:hypothetical protein
MSWRVRMTPACSGAHGEEKEEKQLGKRQGVVIPHSHQDGRSVIGKAGSIQSPFGR